MTTSNVPTFVALAAYFMRKGEGVQCCTGKRGNVLPERS